MPFRIQLLPLATRQIASWGLSPFVWTEVLLRLHQHLRENPASLLERTEEPFNGMSYRFQLIDPENRLCQHFFAFHVLYGVDETTLFVARGAYGKTVGI